MILSLLCSSEETGKCLEITPASHSSPLIINYSHSIHWAAHTLTSIHVYTLRALTSLFHYMHTCIHTRRGWGSERKGSGMYSCDGVSQREIRLVNKLWSWAGKLCVCERMCEMHSEGWLPGHAIAAIDTKQKLHGADVVTFPDVLLLDYNLFHLMPIKGCFNW